MSRSICLYMHVHQPFRVRPYSIFEVGTNHDYFAADSGASYNNRNIVDKVSEKSYLPTNAVLRGLLEENPDFKLSLSITGVLIEQLEMWRPDVLDSFKELVGTGRVELLSETYHHSLAFFYNRQEFEIQVEMHKQKIRDVFGVETQVFRNTELSYNNELADWAKQAGFKGALLEGWDPILGWRSPNFVYKSPGERSLPLLLKNYRLSDDIAFRFSDESWHGWPLTADKFKHWVDAIPEDQPLVNLFVDYETFGEHQWEHSGIFEFLREMPKQFLADTGNSFKTVSEAIDAFTPVDVVDVPDVLTWADTERDLSAWTGNAMQQEALRAIYDLAPRIEARQDLYIWEDWRKLQTSDHFYYMCTKWFNDGDIHAYFSPYDSPYEAFIAFMNAVRDIDYRLRAGEND